MERLAIPAALAALREPLEPGPVSAIVLGIAQDGGHPQAGCARPCCAAAWADARAAHAVCGLGVVDGASGARWLIDATPDLPRQLRALQQHPPEAARLDGVLLTHAHVGHYLGLAHLGREGMAAAGVPVLAMPRMCAFLEQNAPWELLVRLGHARLRPLADGAPAPLSPRLRAIPFAVPHRAEYTETAGFLLQGPRRAALYLPDVDAWGWGEEALIAAVDVAWIDGTFGSAAEVAGRDLAEIPHPPVETSLERFAALPAAERAKIRFIHLNHTNPALDPGSELAARVRAAGMGIAAEGEIVHL